MSSQADLFEATGLDDLLLPFQVVPFNLRGRVVRVGAVAETILTRHGYPEPVSRLLGETLALAATLAGALKYEGIFTVQTKGDGPVRTLMADVTSAGVVRGYAAFDEEKVAAVSEEDALSAPVPRLLGGGYIAFTVDQGEHTERYQGIVELQGATLSECTHAYFRQSEQLQTGIKLASGRDLEGRWRSGAIMLQRMPSEGRAEVSGERSANDDDPEEAWRRAMTLMSSATAAELLDPDMRPDRLVHRLFHEDGVRGFPAHGLSAQCRCSDAKVERVLLSFPQDDIDDLKIDGELSVMCEFCKVERRYDQAALDRLRAEADNEAVD
jgi:molecular chaperone Hsp33